MVIVEYVGCAVAAVWSDGLPPQFDVLSRLYRQAFYADHRADVVDRVLAEQSCDQLYMDLLTRQLRSGTGANTSALVDLHYISYPGPLCVVGRAFALDRELSSPTNSAYRQSIAVFRKEFENRRSLVEQVLRRTGFRVRTRASYDDPGRFEDSAHAILETVVEPYEAPGAAASARLWMLGFKCESPHLKG